MNMDIIYFLFSFFFFKFSLGAAYSVISSGDKELGWNVTYSAQYSFRNGRTYYTTGLHARRNDSATRFRLSFLGDKGSNQGNLSIVAYDMDGEDYADVIWAVKGSVGINATVQLEADGNLVLRNELKVAIWSTQTSNLGVKRIRLTEYGALLLLNSTNHTVWSSFQSPTNKLVCGQVLQSGMELANGDYHLRAERNGAALYFHQHLYQEWDVSYLKVTTFVVLCCDEYYATLQLGYDTGNISDAGYYEQNYKDCGSSMTVHYMFYLSWGSRTTNATYEAVASLGGDGVLTLTKLSAKTHSEGTSSCDSPNYCGKYGVCYPSNDSCSTCALNFTYFTPIEKSNLAAGCQLASGYSNKSVDCQMISQPEIGYYATSFSSPNQTRISEDKCYRSCLNYSTCNAAFHNQNTSECFLVDEIYSLIAESTNYSASFKLCKQHYASKRISSAIIAIIIVGICFLLFIIVLAFYFKMRCMKDGEEEDGILSSYLSETTLRRFSLKELEQITSGFSEKLGSGAFGTVYKGQLPNGNYVAVKSLNGLRQDAKDFYAELSVLSRVHHFNLVQLLGFCSNQKTRALVYEYMVNGSLDHWLRGENSSLLGWEARVQIAVGSARGIAYLHEECLERILHLDIKPQNILLDDNFYPRVSDFGLSRLLNRNEDHFFMTTICGTPGYLAPELMSGEAIGVESDIYSFGVVLLEIVVGARPIQPKGEEFWNLSGDDHDVNSLVDTRLGETFNLEEARRIIKTAALCINYDPSLRPQMSSVVQMLEGVIEIPQFVAAPQFYQNSSCI